MKSYYINQGNIGILIFIPTYQVNNMLLKKEYCQ
jgi:hypothetical protein